MPDFGSEPLDRRRHERQGHEELRVAVAWDHLRRNRLGLEAELLRDMRFDARIDIREGPDRAGNSAGRDLLTRRGEAGAVAREFGVVAGELQSELRRLSMDAVAAP